MPNIMHKVIKCPKCARADAVTIAQVLRDVLKNEVKQNDNEIQSL